MLLRVLIAEDEPVSARMLRGLIEEHLGRPASIRIAPTLEAARCALWEYETDLLFLDLNLRGEDGYSLLEEAVAGAFSTIVVSAHTDQALRAFEYGVVDFVPKPVKPSRIAQALTRYREGKKSSKLQFLSCLKDGIVTLIPIADIVYAQGSDKHSIVRLASGDEVKSRKSLKMLELVLPDSFIRVHKSYLVQKQLMVEVKARADKDYYAILQGGLKVPISRSLYGRLKNSEPSKG